MAKHKCPECPAGEKWAVPYADFLSLLLALFIALWAISESNPSKTEALKTEFIKIFDFTPSQTVQEDSANQQRFKGASRNPQEQEELEALKSLTASQQQTIQKLKQALDQSENQVALQLPARVEFDRGSAEIKSSDVQDFLKYMVEFSLRLPSTVQIEIRGYTDNSDTASNSFNLGYDRAKSVADYFISGGVSVKNISIKSYGLNSPLENNDANSLRNNRAEIFYKIETTDQQTQRSVLENLNQFEGNVE
ncbi:flagellar motor protein MotB [Campylobacter troglodytis]|uniref:flagellar motor protein MotB n=1 Tax=Campylobacter troglodytis TaxID=654363 RepID=UPI0011596FD1|nr:flagellar motor protein MotB [Campylobacter troglodytis]TQR61623.1 flagellar motor protein MotB [Campylobacter troglodytis]